MKDRRLHIVVPEEQLSDTDVREILTDQILQGLEAKWITTADGMLRYELAKGMYDKIDTIKTNKLIAGGAYFEGAVCFGAVVEVAFLDTARRVDTDPETGEDINVLWRETVIFINSKDGLEALILFTEKPKGKKNGTGMDKKSSKEFFLIFKDTWLSPTEVEEWKAANRQDVIE